MEGNNRVNPPWLSRFLTASFFDPKHTHSKKVNFFCNDCKGDALCEDCHTHQHKGHNVLKVCKSTECPAIPIEVIGTYIDITNIKPFIINSKPIVFLNSRQKKEFIKGSSLANRCENCGWVIDGSSSYKFCSIACKLCPNMMIFANGDDRRHAVTPRRANQSSSTKDNAVVDHGELKSRPSNNFVIVVDHGKKRVRPSKKRSCIPSDHDDEHRVYQSKKRQHVSRSMKPRIKKQRCSTTRNDSEVQAPPRNQPPSMTTNRGEVHVPPGNQPPSTATKVSYRKKSRKAENPQRSPLK